MVLLLIFAVRLQRNAPHFNSDQADEAYRELRSKLDPEMPGRGVADYADFPVADVPKSYAMVMIAEFERRKSHPDHSLNLAEKAGLWLLEHSDENGDGVPGWGLPIAWDAYGDGSINPPNTEYCISTAIVTRALLDWLEIDPLAPSERIKTSISEALSRWTDQGLKSPSGLIPYSMTQADRPYDTFNPAIYLAGQMQRYSVIAPPNLAANLRQAADASMQVLLDQRLTDSNGNWYWTYSIQEKVPNDLAHAVYIMDGVSNYVRYGGRLAGRFNVPLIYGHLRSFLRDDDSYVSDFPTFRDIEQPARSYDLGIGLWFASQDPILAGTVAPRLARHIPEYRRQDGLYRKYPKAGDQRKDDLAVGEYQAYVLAALAAWSAGAGEDTPDRMPFISSEARQRALNLNRQTSFVSDVEVPLSSLESKGKPAKLFLNVMSQSSSIRLDTGRILRFDSSGVPVHLIDLPDGRLWVIFRSFPDDHLRIIEYDAGYGSDQARSFTLDDQDDGYLFFRAALADEKKVSIVVYNNRSRRNILRRYPIGRGDMFSEVTLPSLEDPAGGNYEMEPHLFLAASVNGDLRILGGTLDATLRGNNLSVERRRDCIRILEIASGPQGLATLCEAKSRPAFRLMLPERRILDFSPGDGFPWGLEWNNDEKAFLWRLARTPKELGDLFEFDLKRAQNSGLLELGSNNVEGRVAWSQIYYLNGFMDLLNLAETDQRAYDAFEDLIEPIRKRIDIELALLDAVLSSPLYYRTRAFTVRREPALFAVQTGRLLALLHRWAHELPGASPSQSYDRVREDVYRLKGHMEELAIANGGDHWIPKGRYYLRWPRGCPFPYDGVGVPYNHQNEWAWSLFETKRDSSASNPVPLDPARDIIKLFYDHILAPNGGRFPTSGRWRYWWGKAYDGWSESEGISVNTPSYSGDHGWAWISFRTIDTMAVISAIPEVSDLDAEAVLSSASSLLRNGDIYPFAAGALIRFGRYPIYSPVAASRYVRVGPPSDIPNAVWVIARGMIKEEKTAK